MKQNEIKAFTRGVAYAMGILYGYFDHQSAEFIKNESGITWDEILDANVDEFDKDNCYPLYHPKEED